MIAVHIQHRNAPTDQRLPLHDRPVASVGIAEPGVRDAAQAFGVHGPRAPDYHARHQAGLSTGSSAARGVVLQHGRVPRECRLHRCQLHLCSVRL